MTPFLNSILPSNHNEEIHDSIDLFKQNSSNIELQLYQAKRDTTQHIENVSESINTFNTNVIPELHNIIDNLRNELNTNTNSNNLRIEAMENQQTLMHVTVENLSQLINNPINLLRRIGTGIISLIGFNSLLFIGGSLLLSSGALFYMIFIRNTTPNIHITNNLDGLKTILGSIASGAPDPSPPWG